MQPPLVKNHKKAKTLIIFCIAIAILFAIFFMPRDTILISSESTSRSTPATTNIEDSSNSSIYIHSKEQEPMDNTYLTVGSNDLAKVPDVVEDNIHIYEKIFDTHLNWLQEMNYIIIKFFEDLPYTDHINYIKSQNLPHGLQELITRLDEYNVNFLLNPMISKEKEQLVFPKNNLLIKKFIRIRKVSNNCKNKDELKSIIIKDLNTYIQYLYSNKFFKDFSTNRLEQ